MVAAYTSPESVLHGCRGFAVTAVPTRPHCHQLGRRVCNAVCACVVKTLCYAEVKLRSECQAAPVGKDTAEAGLPLTDRMCRAGVSKHTTCSMW